MTIHAVPPAATIPEAPLLSRESLAERLPDLQRSVFLLCLGFCGDPGEARDLAQETFLRALSRPRRLAPDALRPWLLRIARNACIDRERRRRIRRLFMPRVFEGERDQADPEHRHMRNEDIDRVRRAVDTLPRNLREVLVLREYGELNYREIAAMLGLKEGTVMSRLHRARAAVLRLIREENHGQST